MSQPNSILIARIKANIPSLTDSSLQFISENLPTIMADDNLPMLLNETTRREVVEGMITCMGGGLEKPVLDADKSKSITGTMHLDINFADSMYHEVDFRTGKRVKPHRHGAGAKAATGAGLAATILPLARDAARSQAIGVASRLRPTSGNIRRAGTIVTKIASRRAKGINKLIRVAGGFRGKRPRRRSLALVSGFEDILFEDVADNLYE